MSPEKLDQLQRWGQETLDLKNGETLAKYEERMEKQKLTEGAKNDTGKPAYGLIAPELLHAVASILEFGARKYEARNWELGISYTRVFGGLMRHLWAWWGGSGPTRHNMCFEELDTETGFSHLWHAGCGIMFLIAYESRGLTQFDDRTRK